MRVAFTLGGSKPMGGGAPGRGRMKTRQRRATDPFSTLGPTQI
jgi:hypothetical protein